MVHIVIPSPFFNFVLKKNYRLMKAYTFIMVDHAHWYWEHLPFYKKKHVSYTLMNTKTNKKFPVI